MRVDLRVRPAGSFVVITDDLYAEMPEFEDGPKRIWANQWSVGVGTVVDVDGETHLQISDTELQTELPLVFDGFIEAPNGRVTVSDAHLTEFGAVPVGGPKARIRVWTNHPSEPDQILVAVG